MDLKILTTTELQDKLKDETLNYDIKEKILEELDERFKTLVEYEEVEGTPFTVAKNENKYYILCGNSLVHDKGFEDKLKANEYCKEVDWEKITKIIYIMSKKILKQNEQ